MCGLRKTSETFGKIYVTLGQPFVRPVRCAMGQADDELRTRFCNPIELSHHFHRVLDMFERMGHEEPVDAVAIQWQRLCCKRGGIEADIDASRALKIQIDPA